MSAEAPTFTFADPEAGLGDLEPTERRLRCPECGKNTVDRYPDGSEQCDAVPACFYHVEAGLGDLEPSAPPEPQKKTVENVGGFVDASELREQILPPPAPPHLMDLGEALDAFGVEVKWIVHRLFAEGDSSLLTARPGIGKSWFAQQLAVAVALGRPFLGRAVQQQGLVIYFAFEGPQQTVRRLARLGLPKACDTFKLWTAATDGSAPAAWLEKIVEKRKPVLIILDCLQNIAQAKEGNSYSETYKLLAPLVQYAVRTKTHVHALHHSSAKEERAGIGSALGSTAIPANFGTVLHMRKLDPRNTDGSAPRVLECAEKHRFGLMGVEDIPTVVLTANAFTAELMVTGSFVEARVQHAGLNIIRSLATASEPMTRAELVEIASIRKQDFEGLLTRLLKAGAIARSPKQGTRGHLYSAGPTGEREWTASFMDRGATAFEPPAVPQEDSTVAAAESAAVDF